MINEVRTLLLNRSCDFFSGVEGAVYIDKGFRPLFLGPRYAALRSDIFLGASGPKQESERADSVMSLLHCPELEADVLSFDPRVTYAVGTRDPVAVISGTSAGPDVVGICERSKSAYSFVLEGGDDFVSRMRDIWSASFEPYLVFGAFILAYTRRLATGDIP